ncbi:uncharacterized protein LOC128232375 [Mya arenaria]|nr:uncharacterized protein LOC128232375 [Mya arenaria]
MGELVRRLDYERRSRQRSLLAAGSSGQRISKEYSSTVRYANEMEERRRLLYVQDMEKHKRLVIDRYNYERKVMTKFKNELDSKTQNFNEEKYQQLRRVKSANGRIQNSYQNTDIGKVIELVPRHYYRTKSAVGVKFLCNSDESGTDDDDSDVFKERDTDSQTDISADRYINGHTSGGQKEEKSPSELTQWSSMWKKRHTKSALRRRMSYSNFISEVENPVNIDIASRRQSAPPKVITAFIPPDLSTIKKRLSISRPQSSASGMQQRRTSQPNLKYKRPSTADLRRMSAPALRAKSASQAALGSRRGSVSSVASSSSLNGSVNGGDEKENTSRSYRLLREAFKKMKIEQPDYKKEWLDRMKEDHLSKTEHLHERTLEKFCKLFDGGFFTSF